MKKKGFLFSEPMELFATQRVMASIIFFICCFVFELSILNAQVLNVRHNDDTQTTYELEKIRSITFSPNNIKFYFKEGNIDDYSLDNVRNLNFNEVSIVKLTNEFKDANLILYPNPAENIIVVKSKSNDLSISRIEIVDLEGSIWYCEELNADADRVRTQINISMLPAGVYFCRVQISEFIATEKFIKK